MTIKIEFLDVMVTTSFSLRKLKKINVQQKGKVWNPRSNTHCLIVMPFGHQKSTIAKSIQDKKAVYKCDTFTEASFKGSISKDGEIVPPIMKDFGGKVVFIDEWNSINHYAQTSLLSAMENQEFMRTIGFTARKPWEYKDNYMKITIEDNVIKSEECFFSLVAFAMSFPSHNNSQEAMALLSRFVPIFIESDKDLIQAMMLGEWQVNIKDYSNWIEEISIGEDLFQEIYKEIWIYIENERLMPDDPDLNGFLVRCQADIIRIGIMYYFKNNWNELRQLKKKKGLAVEIKTIEPFREALKWFSTIMNQYLNPKTKGKVELYMKLKEEYPNETQEFYANKMGVTQRQIRNYELKMGGSGLI